MLGWGLSPLELSMIYYKASLDKTRIQRATCKFMHYACILGTIFPSIDATILKFELLNTNDILCYILRARLLVHLGSCIPYAYSVFKMFLC